MAQLGGNSCRTSHGLRDGPGPEDASSFMPSMRRLTFVLLNAWLLMITWGAEAQVTRDNLLVFQDGQGKVQPVRTPEEWKSRRQAILRAAQEIMGPLPGAEKACPLEVETVEETDCGTFFRRLVSYMSEPGSRVRAYLLIPKQVLAGKRSVAGVLCLHPTDNTIGHKVVVGLGGKEHRQYAVELAERGFVTIAPPYPLLADYQPDLTALGYVSGTMKAIHDNRRALDLLDTLPFVRHGSYAAIGHSLGGHNSAYTALFDERLRVVVSSCGLDSFRDYKGGDIRGWTHPRYMPRLLAYRERLNELPIDFAEIIAALAPRTVFVSAPLHDDNFKADSVDRIAANARPVFELLGAGDRLILEHPDGVHDFQDAMREKAFGVIERALNSE